MMAKCQHESNLLYRPDTEAEAARWPAEKVRRVCPDCKQFFVGGHWRTLTRKDKESLPIPGTNMHAEVTVRVYPGVASDLGLPCGLPLAEAFQLAEAQAEAAGELPTPFDKGG
jgi:hypothetical protein